MWWRVISIGLIGYELLFLMEGFIILLDLNLNAIVNLRFVFVMMERRFWLFRFCLIY